jgi:hypothetical protein
VLFRAEGHARASDQPYEANPAGFTDPVESNVGTGWGKVSGRVTALATDGPVVYLGSADGGVWRTFDQGGHWFAAVSGLGSVGRHAGLPADAGRGRHGVRRDHAWRVAPFP